MRCITNGLNGRPNVELQFELHWRDLCHQFIINVDSYARLGL